MKTSRNKIQRLKNTTNLKAYVRINEIILKEKTMSLIKLHSWKESFSPSFTETDEKQSVETGTKALKNFSGTFLYG